MHGFDADTLAEAAARRGLVLPHIVLDQVTAAVRAGEHLILTGAPGTGKTTLAMAAADAAAERLLCSGHRLATASADWTTEETVGAYRPGESGMAFVPGLVLTAIEQGEWLIIDELNRAPADRALGELFTVLSGQPVTLPFNRPLSPRPIALVPPGCEVPPGTDPVQIPASWRIVATMNTSDRDLLHTLSSALLRRFAVVEVPTLPDDEMAGLLQGPGGELARQLLGVRRAKDLGPAIFLSAARLADALLEGGSTRSEAAYGAFSSHVLPQLDGLGPAEVQEVRAVLADLLDRPELELADRTLAARAGTSDTTLVP